MAEYAEKPNIFCQYQPKYFNNLNAELFNAELWMVCIDYIYP